MRASGGRPPLLVRQPMWAAVVQVLIVGPIAVLTMFKNVPVGVALLAVAAAAAVLSYRWFNRLHQDLANGASS